MQTARAPNRKKERKEEAGPEAKKFGDRVTANHMITRGHLNIGAGEEKTALVIRDKFTKWLSLYAVRSASHRAAVPM